MRETYGRNSLIKQGNYYSKLMHAVAWSLYKTVSGKQNESLVLRHTQRLVR